VTRNGWRDPSQVTEAAVGGGSGGVPPAAAPKVRGSPNRTYGRLGRARAQAEYRSFVPDPAQPSSGRGTGRT